MKISRYEDPVFAWDGEANDWRDSPEELYSESECQHYECEHYDEELCSIGEKENAKDLAKGVTNAQGTSLSASSQIKEI